MFSPAKYRNVGHRVAFLKQRLRLLQVVAPGLARLPPGVRVVERRAGARDARRARRHVLLVPHVQHHPVDPLRVVMVAHGLQGERVILPAPAGERLAEVDLLAVRCGRRLSRRRRRWVSSSGRPAPRTRCRSSRCTWRTPCRRRRWPGSPLPTSRWRRARVPAGTSCRSGSRDALGDGAAQIQQEAFGGGGAPDNHARHARQVLRQVIAAARAELPPPEPATSSAIRPPSCRCSGSG